MRTININNDLHKNESHKPHDFVVRAHTHTNRADTHQLVEMRLLPSVGMARQFPKNCLVHLSTFLLDSLQLLQ